MTTLTSLRALVFSTLATLAFAGGCSSKSDAPAGGSAASPPPITTSVSSGSGSAGSAAGSADGSGAGSSAGSGAGSSAGSGAGSAAGSGAGSSAGSGAGSGGAAGSGSAAGSGGGSDAEPASEFDKLDRQGKIRLMKTKVMPTMRKAFQEFDGKAFAKFGCKTCHGAGAKSDYKMPNPELPKLDFAALKAGKQEPKMAEFMGKIVKPQMAAMLGQHEYDDSHPDGFGCLECHEQKK